METTTLTEQAERLLIWQNRQQIDQVTNDLSARANILNKLADFGLSNDQIKEITVSASAIDSYIGKRQLETNREFAKLVKAGIQGLTAELPQDLAAIKYSLLAWFNYSMPSRSGNKYQFLIFTDRWKINEPELEKHLEMSGQKLFIVGEKLSEYKTICSIRDYLLKMKAEVGQIYTSTFLSQRFTNDSTQGCIGFTGPYIPKASYFRR